MHRDVQQAMTKNSGKFNDQADSHSHDGKDL